MEIFTLSSITGWCQYLYFCTSKASNIQVEIDTLSSITALHLDDNNITSLPPSIERLTSLTELTLTNLQVCTYFTTTAQYLIYY